jgi:type IV pilus assembly protein PilC
MLGAGVPLSQALSTLQEEIENSALKSIIIQILRDIKEGQSFAASLAKHPNVFSPIYINMVAAGEVSGNMEDVLQKVSHFVQKQMELSQKITTALFYPLVLICFGILVVTYLVMFVFPNFIKIFNEAGVPLPLPTMVLYQIHIILKLFWMPILLGLIAFILALNAISRMPKGKEIIDMIAVRIPLVGSLLLKAALARFAWSLSGLLGSGVTLLEALETVEKVVGNVQLRQALVEVRDAVSKGDSIAKKMIETKRFPPLVVQMVKIGEEAGSLPDMLNKVAEHYDLMVDYGVKRLTTLIEPIALLFIGGAVAFIFASLILPIFRMVQVLRQ